MFSPIIGLIAFPKKGGGVKSCYLTRHDPKPVGPSGRDILLQPLYKPCFYADPETTLFPPPPPTMAPSFVFEPPSDEEVEYTEAEDEEQEQIEEEEEGEQSEGEEEGGGTARVSNKKSQSPWDFAKYSESVAEEHARRSTTSVDQKIAKALKERSTQLRKPTEDDSESSESEPDKQVTGFSFFFWCRCICVTVCKRLVLFYLGRL